MDLTPSIPTAQGIFFILFFPYFSFTPPHESELTPCSIGRRRCFFFFFFTPEKEHRTDALFIGPRPFSFSLFFFFFSITFYRATSWLRAYPLLKWSSTIFLPFFFFFFFSRHLVAQSRHTAQSVLDHFPSFFFFFFSRHLVAQSKHAAQSVLDRFFLYYATSWLRAGMLHNRS